jgi:hypothetical protein
LPHAEQVNRGSRSDSRTIIRPSVATDRDVVAAFVIGAIDQQPANARLAHFGEGDFVGICQLPTHRYDLFQPTKVMMMVAQSIARLARPYPTVRSGCDIGEEYSTATNGAAVMAISTRPIQNSPLILKAVAVIGSSKVTNVIRRPCRNIAPARVQFTSKYRLTSWFEAATAHLVERNGNKRVIGAYQNT